MVGAGVVEINGFLDQTLAQQNLIKIEIGLRIAGYGRDVMDAVHKLVL
jgi:hypothetical protein